jgi:hypothetical protein
VALALSVAAAVWDTRWRVVPTDDGAWRGVSDPPTALRIAVSLAAGLAGAALLSRAPRPVRQPVLALGLAALPAVPVLTGRLLPLLVFQGPVLVLLVSAVLAVVMVRALGAPGVRSGVCGPGNGSHVSPPTQTTDNRPDPRLDSRLLFVTGFAFFAFLSTRWPGAAGPQGDEPQYLLLAHSLLTDGDVDLADEFAHKDYGAFFAGELEPHTSPLTRPGRAYSIHTPGLAVLVLPAYALGGYPGVRLWLAALSALAAVLVHRVVRASLGDEALAAAAWAVLVFTPPVPFYAMRVYPETAAALAAAIFLAAPLDPAPRRAALLAAAVAAALPWFHPKLLLLSVLGLALTLARRVGWTVRMAGVGALALSLGLLLAHFQAQFGHASLHGGFPIIRLQASRLAWGLPAVLFDRQFGLFAVSAVFALAAPGTWLLLRRRARDAAGPVLVAGLFLGLAGAFEYWWGGACPPARYVMPGVPALAVLLAPALRLRPALAAALAGLGLGVLGLAAEAPRIVHNRADGESLLLRFLSPAFDLNGLFPSFFDEGSAPLVVSAALVIAGVAAWRWRGGGLLAGAAALVLASAAVSERPLVDHRAATLDLMWDWEPQRLRGPSGVPTLDALSVPFELPRAPWRLTPGEARNSRRVDVPPGLYAFEAAIDATAGPARVRIELGSGPLVFAQVDLDASRREDRRPVLLPVGARRLGVSAAGVAGEAELARARLVPEALVPRAERGRFGWPEHAGGERYRVAGGGLRVTAVAGAAPEGEGLRIEDARGEVVVDGAPEAVAELLVVRPRPSAADAIEWGSRAVALGPRAEVVLHLPMGEGLRLGTAAVVPLRVRADGAWLRVREAPR